MAILTYLHTYLVLLYNVPFRGLSWTPLPTLIWDVINERSLNDIFLFVKHLTKILPVSVCSTIYPINILTICVKMSFSTLWSRMTIFDPMSIFLNRISNFYWTDEMIFYYQNCSEFRPTVRKNCSSDWEKLLQTFAKILR